jgi:hypothetical protein
MSAMKKPAQPEHIRDIAFDIINGRRATTDVETARLNELDGELRRIIRVATEVRSAIARRLTTNLPQQKQAAIVETTQRRKAGLVKSRERFRAIVKAEVRKELYDELFIRGRKVGDIWSNEFEQFKRSGAFEASLFDQLQKHAKTATPVKVRDIVSEATLEKMVRAAERDAGGKYQP